MNICPFAIVNFVAGLLFTPATAQVLETDPVFPAEDQPVTIIFDAAEASQEDLEDYTGAVYAHTGVILSEDDTNSGNWEYVIGTWGDNDSQPQLTSLGDTRWELEIDDIREFYDIPDSVERIYQLALVFRSADGELQSEDLFVDLFDEEILVGFTNPFTTAPNPYFAEQDETIDFEIEGSSAARLSSITLYENDNEIASVSDSDKLEYSYNVNTTGRIDFFVKAEDEDGAIAEDSLYIVVNPDLVREPREEGIEDGITYHEDGSSVTFSIYAPEKEFVYLIGTATDWEVKDEFYMKLDDTDLENPRFWLKVDDLTPGETYLFQYLVDGEIRVADPFSEMILDPDSDQEISDTVFPGLPDYPEGLTDHVVSVVEPGREEFDWQVTDFERPAEEKLVIYELLLRDFVEESTFEILADTLGYLERLGVNAIELMPVSEFDGNRSWGYNPVFHGALEKSYGTRQAFMEFVDTAHERGIAVILDVVYNHAHDKSPLIRIFGTDRSESFAEGNPLIGPGHAYNVFYHLNHDHHYIRYWLDRMNRYWLETYNIDGFRFDLSKGFATNVNSQSLLDGYNTERIENLKRMADEIWSVDEDAYLILEHLAANSEELELSDYGMMLWGNHNFNYSEGVMGYNEGDKSDMAGIYFGNRDFSAPLLVGYMESHDEQWLMHKAREFGNSSNPDHNISEDLDTALQRMKLAGVFFFTIPGPKMLWQFGELGYGWGEEECLKPGDGSDGDCAPSAPRRTDEKPVRWEYFDEENRRNLYRSWSELIRFRNSSPAFTSADTQFSSSLSGDVKWIRLENEDMDAVIIGNFGVEKDQASVTFTKEGEWYEFVTGSAEQIEDISVEFEMEPGAFKIFTTKEIEPAEDGVFFKTEENSFESPAGEILLEPNHPNPFETTTNLTYNVPEDAPVTLTVYDILGRQVAELVHEENHNSGIYTVSFEGSGLSSGLYIARLISGSVSVVQKMVLIK